MRLRSRVCREVLSQKKPLDVKDGFRSCLNRLFQMFFIFIPTWGDDPIWLIFCITALNITALKNLAVQLLRGRKHGLKHWDFPLNWCPLEEFLVMLHWWFFLLNLFHPNSLVTEGAREAFRLTDPHESDNLTNIFSNGSIHIYLYMG